MTPRPGREGSALVAIITVVEEELAAVRAVEQFQGYAGDTPYFFRNRVADKKYDVILARCADRSNTPCSELVAELAESFRPEFIILSGIAGGVGGRDGVGLGDVIIADHVEGFEMKKLENRRGKTRRVALDHPSKYLRETIAHRVRHSNDWKAKIRAQRPVDGDPNVIVGNLIAGEKILGDGQSKYQRDILSEFDKAVAVDMESHGLARGVYSARSVRHYNLNYLIVRGISDLVDDKGNNETRRQWRDYAAATAAAFAMSAADQLVACCP
jgi:nucleoside phosphorylase